MKMGWIDELEKDLVRGKLGNIVPDNGDYDVPDLSYSPTTVADPYAAKEHGDLETKVAETPSNPIDTLFPDTVAYDSQNPLYNAQPPYLPDAQMYWIFPSRQTTFGRGELLGMGYGLGGINFDPGSNGGDKNVNISQLWAHPLEVATHEWTHDGPNMHGKNLSEWLTRQITEGLSMKPMPNPKPAYLDTYVPNPNSLSLVRN